MSNAAQKDDALFEALGKTKKKKKRRIARTIIIIVLVLAIVLVAAVGILQRRVRERFASDIGEVLEYVATTGTISTLVSGSGTLSNVDTETVCLPEGVEIRERLVDVGDIVAEGDLLATVDLSTVRNAMSELQSHIEELDELISDAEGDKVDSYVRAGVSGRVKIIYAEKNMAVADCMVANGALAVISLDGYMALDIETDTLSVGDTVSVIRAEGAEISGRVESVSAGIATVLVSDNGPRYDEEVTVKTQDGTELGTARLYIHKPLSVTGYAGTVNNVNVKENQQLYSSTTVFTLTDTNFSANYDSLLRERIEAEETLLELLVIQRNGGLVAPISGSIFSVADEESEELGSASSTNTMSSSAMAAAYMSGDFSSVTAGTAMGSTALPDTLSGEVLTISPDISMSVTISVDESDILSLELGQQADVTVSSVSDEKLCGILTEIDKTAATGSYSATITLDKLDGMLAGMTAEVDVRIEGIEEAIIIPVDALHQTSTGAFVYTSYDSETEEYGGKVDVETGLANNEFVEVRSGLSEGDIIYYTKTWSIMDLFSGMGFGF